MTDLGTVEPSSLTLWLELELGVETNDLGHLLYPDSLEENKNGRELMQRWRHGHQLPTPHAQDLPAHTCIGIKVLRTPETTNPLMRSAGLRPARGVGGYSWISVNSCPK